MEQTGKNRLDWALVVLLTVAGLALRLAYSLRVPPFLDEYSSILTGLSILRTGGIPELPSGVLYPNGSLFSYLEAAFIGLFGLSDTVARLPSLLVSVATLPVLYLTARYFFNRRVALLSVALLAMHPEAVVWGGRARMYALLQLLVLLSLYFFYRNCRRTSRLVLKNRHLTKYVSRLKNIEGFFHIRHDLCYFDPAFLEQIKLITRFIFTKNDLTGFISRPELLDHTRVHLHISAPLHYSYVSCVFKTVQYQKPRNILCSTF